MSAPAEQVDAVITGESGFTIPELLVTMSMSLIIFFAIFTLADVTLSNSARVQGQVEANQRARPAMQHILNELHSTCLGPGSTPILTGSTSDSIAFQHQTGSAVAPVPVKRTITYSAGTLVERTYAQNGGEAPLWTYSSTPSTTRTLLERVQPATLGNPNAVVPFFRYYADSNGSLSSTPLPTPLSSTNAARVVSVNVSFATLPRSATRDASLAVSLSDSAYLRFSPFSEDISTANAPCD